MMTKEDIFKQKLIAPLIECYGQQKLPAIRIKAIWEKLKTLPDVLFSKSADRIVLNHDNFPGVHTILNIAAEVSSEYMRTQSEDIKSKIRCSLCNSQGVRIINNYAYKCTCQLGELCYPAYPLYAGQIQDKETVTTGESSEYIFENGTMQSIVPKNCQDIRQIKTVIKRPDLRIIKNNGPVEVEFKTLKFPGFRPEGA